MGIYDRDYTDKRFEDPKRRVFFGIRASSSLTMLIFVNLVIFVLLYFLFVIFLLTGSGDVAITESGFRYQVLRLFALPGGFSGFVGQPWSIITFMFVHFELGAIFSNMLWLWVFGSILEELSDNKVAATYIYGSLLAGVVYLSVNSLFPTANFGSFNTQYYGAAAGVMAVAIAATSLEPDYRLFKNIGRGLPLWIMTLLYVMISLAAMPFNYIIIVSSAITGFMMIWFLRRGRDLSAPLNNFFYWATNMFNPDRKKQQTKKRFQLQYQSKAEPFKRTPNVNQQKIDEILDKINKDGGTHRLTKEEKDILRRAGEEL